MKKIIALFLTFATLLALISCSAGTTQPTQPSNNQQQSGNNNQQQEPELSAYDQLSSDEKMIFDALLISLDSFIAPSSVRFTGVFESFGSEWETATTSLPQTANDERFGVKVFLKLSFQNTLGATNQGYFSLVIKDGTWKNDYPSACKGYIYQYTSDNQLYSSVLKCPSISYISVAKLNKALQEYYTDMGWV